MKKDWQKLELGALWKKFSKSGDGFYTGNLKVDGKSFKIICFANTNKKSDNQPDVRIYLDEDDGKGKTD